MNYRTYFKNAKVNFYYEVYDKKNLSDKIDGGFVEARNKTEARREILESARREHNVPYGRMARDCGYVPLSDWHIVFVENNFRR